MMKIDLDELERKARAVGEPWFTGQESWGEAAYETVEHAVANAPPVTLALIARIRELESTLLLCRDALDSVEDGCPASREITVLLDNGVVLP